MDASRLFDVGGVLLARPFRVRRLGHFGLNMTDTQAAIAFYCDLLGFRISDPMDIAEQHPRREELLRIGDTNLYFTRHGTDQPTPRSSCAVSNKGRPTTLEWLPARKRMKPAPSPWMA